MAALRALAASPDGLTVTCEGTSMEPTLQAGAQVCVRTARRIGPGDVVLFANAGGDGTILHRVLWVLPGTPWFLHGGDAGRTGGAGVARLDRIIGRAELPRRRPRLDSLVGAGLALAREARRRIRRSG